MYCNASIIEIIQAAARAKPAWQEEMCNLDIRITTRNHRSIVLTSITECKKNLRTKNNIYFDATSLSTRISEFQAYNQQRVNW